MARTGWRPTPLWIAAAACLLLGVASLALPSGPTYDPYSWLIWGRDLSHLKLTLDGTGTSWKPLPAMIDALLTPLGGGAADGWLVVARAGALFAACVAFRLAWRMAPGSRWLAGAAAAATVLLTQHWVNRNGVGGAEGLMVAFGLLAVDRHLDGRRQQAFWLIVTAALIRVEMWPFAFAYALWLWLNGGRRTQIMLGGALIPLLWFGGDWIGSGSLTRASALARRPVHGSLATDPHPAEAVLREASGMLPHVAWLAIAVTLVWAIARRREAILWLAGSAAAWTALVVGMTERGYPGEDRFLFMATGLEAVLAGVGCAVAAGALAHVVTLATRRGQAARRIQTARAAGAVTVATALAVSVAFAAGISPSARMLPADVAAMDKVADTDGKIVRSVQAAGGAAAVLRCGIPEASWYTVSALAYDLNVSPSDIQSVNKNVRLQAPPCRAAAGLPRHDRS